MASQRVQNKHGRPGVLRTTLLLGAITAECERRKGEPALTMPGERARSLAEKLSAADQRKQAAIAELKLAHFALCQCYGEADQVAQQLRAYLFGLYGNDGEELKRFGVRPLYLSKPVAGVTLPGEVLP
jgi:hypothetical protein